MPTIATFSMGQLASKPHFAAPLPPRSAAPSTSRLHVRRQRSQPMAATFSCEFIASAKEVALYTGACLAVGMAQPSLTQLGGQVSHRLLPPGWQLVPEAKAEPLLKVWNGLTKSKADAQKALAAARADQAKLKEQLKRRGVDA
ncbi:GRIP and coiled-coil domain-containing [Chlorella sorokiniana]|uniref:GRIP and coiled-coil domain-containing n=1 Tax=Chlorella sorokiniana TaxID=3076 RepID=A0A2P6TXG2_CHLSO|nr:GRIP and coiled-coil domain-containing [Chlorella sorokiniana]|eukprot:PRW58755.1 GRIP and coiled-coil domain-containing [Chlorella sorokiniana]